MALHEVTWLYGVHRTCAEMAAVSGGTSHASALSKPLRWIFKMLYKKLVTRVDSHASAVSPQKSGEQRYHHHNHHHHHHPSLVPEPQQRPGILADETDDA